MKKYTIGGYGKYRHIKTVSPKKAKELETKGKKTYDSYEEAKRDI
jgi:hypothetical protein